MIRSCIYKYLPLRTPNSDLDTYLTLVHVAYTNAFLSYHAKMAE